MFFKRWDYWLNIIRLDQISFEPIPYIPFKPSYAHPEKLVQKNLKNCLRYADYTSRPLESFIDWLLWGFNQGETFPDINADWLIAGKGEMYSQIRPSKTLFVQDDDTVEQNISEEVINKNDVKEPLKQVDQVSGADDNPQIERIIVFYNDKTFREYMKES